MRSFKRGLAWGAGFLLALFIFGAWDERRAHMRRKAVHPDITWSQRNPWDEM